MQANEGKALETSVDGKSFARIPLRTRAVMPNDDIEQIITEYAASAVQPGDLLFVTEKIVAITQGRSYRLDEIEPRRLALFLSKYVTRTPYGIGLGMPETMEMALRECGTPRILFAADGLQESESRAIFVDPVSGEVRGDMTVYGTSGALPLRTAIDHFHRGLGPGDVARLYSELAASWLGLVLLPGPAPWVVRWRPGRRTPARESTRIPT